MLLGQMHRRIAYKAMDPLTVTALAIEGGSPPDCAILISGDIATIPDGLQKAVRQRIAQRLPSFPLEKVFINATHTHTSLVMEDGGYGNGDGEVMTPGECLELFADRAAEAALEAWGGRTPHSIRSAFSHAVVGHNRRASYADGSSAMYGTTNRGDFIGVEGYEDHSLDVVFTWDMAGRLSGMAIDIPCPSQVDENLEVFSADFWHDIRGELRARFGASLHVLPLCGAAGDQSPHFIIYGREEEEMRRRRGISERREIAMRVADAIQRALLCTVPLEGEVAFAHAVRRIGLTPRQVSRAERDVAQAERDRYLKDGGPNSWWPRLLQEVVDKYDVRQTTTPFMVELHVLRIGTMALATNPFELLIDYGMRIKARSPAEQTIIVQLAAGNGMYLPTARAVQGGGYGAMPAVCEVGPEGGAQLVEETLNVINQLFAK